MIQALVMFLWKTVLKTILLGFVPHLSVARGCSSLYLIWF